MPPTPAVIPEPPYPPNIDDFAIDTVDLDFVFPADMPDEVVNHIIQARVAEVMTRAEAQY